MEPISIRISPDGIGLPSAPAVRAPAGAFGDELGKALGAVDALQIAGDRQAATLAAGGGNLHETALALETADIAMRTAVKVRNKLVESYQEIMRMSL
ncbi:flagellar hook-basal body complex protein FliE [Vulgatibacter incomptus]|uniref:Flagellar hook-basal body complex protein FliE n=1 Tax=Vulgatibacter incomptus TaxID=1391653 RepID=A0A0K1PIU4_9BACT|nr:flagellar hook-basal body complex protein FliE [Vulgatibacter incomptus]AKU93029.1 Flagellar hook-basal body complex protein FliE [Vulgatibacter incomptus]